MDTKEERGIFLAYLCGLCHTAVPAIADDAVERHFDQDLTTMFDQPIEENRFKDILDSTIRPKWDVWRQGNGAGELPIDLTWVQVMDWHSRQPAQGTGTQPMGQAGAATPPLRRVRRTSEETRKFLKLSGIVAVVLGALALLMWWDSSPKHADRTNSGSGHPALDQKRAPGQLPVVSKWNQELPTPASAVSRPATSRIVITCDTTYGYPEGCNPPPGCKMKESRRWDPIIVICGSTEFESLCDPSRGNMVCPLEAFLPGKEVRITLQAEQT
jgi:hypothetical protein